MPKKVIRRDHWTRAYQRGPLYWEVAGSTQLRCILRNTLSRKSPQSAVQHPPWTRCFREGPAGTSNPIQKIKGGHQEECNRSDPRTSILSPDRERKGDGCTYLCSDTGQNIRLQVPQRLCAVLLHQQSQCAGTLHLFPFLQELVQQKRDCMSTHGPSAHKQLPQVLLQFFWCNCMNTGGWWLEADGEVHAKGLKKCLLRQQGEWR